MKLLAVDTATRYQSVALLDGPRVLSHSERDAEGSHAKWLVPTIDQVLGSQGLTVSKLDALAVSIGPGSFTGLRVGLATMLGFRVVHALPLATIPTLEAMAWRFRGVHQPLCPMVKGRTGEVYWALYRWSDSGDLLQLTGDRVSPYREMVSWIHEPTILFGDGWEAYREDLSDDLGVNVYGAPPGAIIASAVHVGLAGLAFLERGEVAPLGVAPRYIQPSEAETNWQRAGPTSGETRTDLGKRRNPRRSRKPGPR